MTPKEIKVRIALFFIMFILIYLATAFIKLEFNFANWSQHVRVCYVLLSTITGLAVASNPYLNK